MGSDGVFLLSVLIEIHLQSISPGPVRTNIFPPSIWEKFKDTKILNPEDVSAAILFALGQPVHVQVFSLEKIKKGRFFDIRHYRCKRLY